MNRRVVLQGLVGLAASSTGRAAASSTEGVRVEDIVIVYRSGLSPEEAAAKELQGFLQQMTGKPPDVFDESRLAAQPSRKVVFWVGRTSKARELAGSGQMDDPGRRHPEAYVVRSIPSSEGKGLVFLGGSGIATLYAVYHYLEKYCGAGFFWDGDHVPSQSRIPVEGVDLQAQPRFSERIYFNGCLWRYSVAWWQWEEWKRYLDWMLKSRFNILDLSHSPGVNAVWEKVWLKFGVKIPDEEWPGPPYDLGGSYVGVAPPATAAWREARAELHKKIVEYARSRGMRLIAPQVAGEVPAAFTKAHPEVHTLKSNLAGFVTHHLPPTGRTYREVGRMFLETYVDLYGTDHLYTLSNLGEFQMQEPEDVKHEYAVKLPRANFDVMDAVDPKGIGILPTWTFLGKEWPPAAVRQCLEQLPADRVRVMDFYSEQAPLYKEYDYFFGAPWLFGVLHAFGGETHLHGNMGLLERQVRGVAEDPRAGQCVGFALMNEVSGFNHFYYQFTCKLGWNPAEVDLASYTRDYAAARYGPAASGPMRRALGELCVSVYGADGFAKPLYWHRPGVRVGASVCEGRAFVPRLRRALEYALEAAPAAGTSRLYLHDVNDIARQYLAELFNQHFLLLLAAFRKLEREQFEGEAALLEQLLGAIEDLLRQDAYYWTSTSIRSARLLPAAPADVDRRVRDVLTVWGGHIRDYACRDTFELVHGYYRPRVVAFIGQLRTQLQNGQRLLDYQPGGVRLERRYGEIEREWVEKGFPLLEENDHPERVVALAREILERFRGAERL
jgi:alpha-N-acetylglucosaminidase